MNYDLEIFYNSNTAESALATIKVKDDNQEFRHARKVGVYNDGSAELIVTFQYQNTDGNWVDTDIADESVVAKAERVFNVWVREGDYLRILGSGDTDGKIVIFEGPAPATSSLSYRTTGNLNVPSS